MPTDKKPRSSLGAQREALLRRARHVEVGAHMTEWLSSPGVQPPE